MQKNWTKLKKICGPARTPHMTYWCTIALMLSMDPKLTLCRVRALPMNIVNPRISLFSHLKGFKCKRKLNEIQKRRAACTPHTQRIGAPSPSYPPRAHDQPFAGSGHNAQIISPFACFKGFKCKK